MVKNPENAEMLVLNIPEDEGQLGRNNSYNFQDNDFAESVKRARNAGRGGGPTRLGGNPAVVPDGNAAPERDGGDAAAKLGAGRNAGGDGNAVDPPTKLIGHFLQRQQESGSFLLDPRMGELTFWEGASNSNRELPSPRSIPEEPEKESREASAQQQPTSNRGSQEQCGLRSRRLYGRAYSRSRLMERPPPPPRSSEQPRRSGPASGAVSGAEGGGSQASPNEEDNDPLGDVPERYEKFHWSTIAALQFAALVLLVGTLVATVKVPTLARRDALGLQLWRWAVMALVVLSGRLLSAGIIRVIVFLLERNFILRKRLLYFVYGLQNGVKNCLWFGIILAAWRFVFNPKLHLPTVQERRALEIVTKILVCFLAAASLWLLKVLGMKVLALNFHVNTYFDRIQESLFNQYILEALTGPPVVYQSAEEKMVAGLIQRGQLNLKSATPATQTQRNGIIGGNGSSSEGSSNGGITIGHLQRLTQKNVSAWNMKKLIRLVKSTRITSLAQQDDYSSDEDGEMCSEWQAKSVAKKIFRNVAPSQKCGCLTFPDLCRFLDEDEAHKAFTLFDGAQETGQITKQALLNWVVHVYRERRALSFSLNDTKTAVKKLHGIIDVIACVIILIISLLILGIATTHLLVVVSSQVVLVAFVFGNTCKMVFEAIIFLFAMHPFDVGDRCVVDGVQMVVEEMNILTTVFLRYDNEKIYYPNSVLATKPISNFYRSPDMTDAIDFSIHVSTPNEKIEALKQKIAKYIEEHLNHWYPKHSVVMKEIEDMNRVRMALWVQHTMNHQDAGEKWIRRSELLFYLKGVFQELGIDYRLLPQEVQIRQLEQ